MNGSFMGPACILYTVTVTKKTFVSVCKILLRTFILAPQRRTLLPYKMLINDTTASQLTPPVSQLLPVVGCVFPFLRHHLLNFKRGHSQQRSLEQSLFFWPFNVTSRAQIEFRDFLG